MNHPAPLSADECRVLRRCLSPRAAADAGAASLVRGLLDKGMLVWTGKGALPPVQTSEAGRIALTANKKDTTP